MNVYKRYLVGSALAVSLGVLPIRAQDSSAPPPPPSAASTHGWHKFGEPVPPPDQRAGALPPDQYPGPPDQDSGGGPPPSGPYQQQPQDGPYPPQPRDDRYPPQVQEGRYPPPPAYRQAPQGPLTVPAGTWITFRVNQPLSSDHNQAGDAFTGTLAQPIVANGFVIARRGQMVAGRVTETQKAGHVKGVSHLAIELTELQLADGRQVPIRTQMVNRQGETSVGRDVAAIGTTTGVGAAIGAAATDSGFGAGMGAIGGAVVSTIGVLATRGRATVLYPETPITFRLLSAVTVADNLQAFEPASQQDYDERGTRPAPRFAGRPPYPYPYYGPYYGPSFYAGYYRPWWGPGWGYGYGYGPGFYGGFGTVVIRGGGHYGHHR